MFLDLTRRHIRHIINLLQGEVQILTGGIVREHAMRADKVQFLDRRYSPDGRSDVFCISTYVCALEGAFFYAVLQNQKRVRQRRKMGKEAKKNSVFKAEHNADGTSVKVTKEDVKQTFAKFKNPRFSTAYITKMAILTAISFLLYAFGKFNLPFMFPQFLEIQISELPALLAGFSMGPISACVVIVLKCLLKFPLSSTVYVGEATDILLGIAFVLPASLIYYFHKDKKHALIGLAVGTVCLTALSILVNRFISIPYYVQLYFNGDFSLIVNLLAPLYKNVTVDTFYTYYLLLGVLPFNVLRCTIVSVLTFLLYKRLSKILHWDGTSMKKSHDVFGKHTVKNIEETYALAKQIASTLKGGEVILLSGDLGAGKTTFTKGLAKALGIDDEVTSPTFTILNVYEDGRLKLNHLDMYRVESADELAELGIEDCFDDDSVTVIEWNKFEHIDGEIIDINITPTGENERVFDVEKRDNK